MGFSGSSILLTLALFFLEYYLQSWFQIQELKGRVMVSDNLGGDHSLDDLSFLKNNSDIADGMKFVSNFQ